MNSRQVKDVYIGDGGLVDNAELVDSTLLSDVDEPSEVTGGARYNSRMWLLLRDFFAALLTVYGGRSSNRAVLSTRLHACRTQCSVNTATSTGTASFSTPFLGPTVVSLKARYQLLSLELPQLMCTLPMHQVTSCLVGPFVGFHHQALLIACFWPSGKGNIGYGANVGSNHTLKAPDQELWPGEGLFFGLGV